MFQKIAGLIALVTEAIHQHKIYKTNSDSADFTICFKAGLGQSTFGERQEYPETRSIFLPFSEMTSTVSASYDQLQWHYF